MKALRTSGERQVRRAGPADPEARAGRSRHPDEGDGHLRERPAPVPPAHAMAPRRRLHLRPRAVRRHRRGGRRASPAGRSATTWCRTSGAAAWQCTDCRTSRRHLCYQPAGSYGHQGCDGSHAEFMRVEQQYLMPLPEHLSFLDGAISACQGGTAYAPLVRMGVSGRDVLVVSGLGPVGLLSLLFAKAMGATIVGIDPSAGRRATRRAARGRRDARSGSWRRWRAAAGAFPGRRRQADRDVRRDAAHGVMGDLLKPHGLGGAGRRRHPEFAVPKNKWWARADHHRIERLRPVAVPGDHRVREAPRRQAGVRCQRPVPAGGRPRGVPARGRRQHRQGLFRFD